MNVSLSNILFVLVVFQLLFLSLFLFTQEKGKRISNVLLGCFFLTISLNLLDVFLFRTGAYSSYPWLAGWGNSLPLLFGPLIYFYTQSVLNKNFAITSKSWKHFLPFIVIFSLSEFSNQNNPGKDFIECASAAFPCISIYYFYVDIYPVLIVHTCFIAIGFFL